MTPGTARDPRAIRRRIVILAAATSGVAAVVLVLVVQLLLAGLATSSADQVLLDEAEEVIGDVDAATTGDRLQVPGQALNAGVVVYDERGRRAAGEPPGALAEVYPQLAAEAPARRTIDDRLRIRAVDFTTTSGARGVVVVTTQMDPYEQTERYALLVTVGAGVVLVVGTLAVATWVSRRMLRPVAEMARTAEEWSERDLSRRFGLGPPTNELTRLAETLDNLLDKVANAIRAEQRLTAELAHELRTPLAAIQGNAELLELRGQLDPASREDLQEIVDACRRMTETITTLLELARSSAPDSVGERARIDELIDRVSAHAAAHPDLATELAVDLRGDEAGTRDLAIHAPIGLVLRALSPVVDNAARMGSRVRLVVEPTDRTVRLHVDDDGPGVDPELADRVFEPGTGSGGSGAGLGLALSRRVARSLGGDVALAYLDDPDGYRTRFTVELPRG